jgi:hypothetical protein
MKFFKNDMFALMLALCASLALVACGDDDVETDTGAPDVTEDDGSGMDDASTDDTTMDDTTMDDTTIDDGGEDTTTDDGGGDISVDGETDVDPGDTIEDTGPVEPEFSTFLCVGDDDQSILGGDEVDVTGEAQDCGLGCLGDPDAGACAQDCVETATGLTGGCSGCYAATVVCSIENCLAPCAADPTSDACGSCQLEFCIGDFNNCSGIVDAAAGMLCDNDADIALIEAGGVTGAAQDCGLGCLGDEDASLCSSRCVLENTGVTAGCSTCYADTVVCSIENCLAPCAADPTSSACGSCQLGFCIDDFNFCSGLSGV